MYKICNIHIDSLLNMSSEEVQLVFVSLIVPNYKDDIHNFFLFANYLIQFYNYGFDCRCTQYISHS